MPLQQIKFYQAGSHVVGNRLLDPEQRTVQAEAGRSNTLTSGHRACQGCGEALGARFVLDAAMRATGGQMVAANATGCLEVFSTPFPETSWQIPWIHSLFGNAPVGRHGSRGRAQGEGPHRRARGRAGRRRRHGRHRLRLPLRDVRAQRRRAVRLLRQRGVHEHGRAALRRHAAGRAHDDHPGSRRRARQPLRAGQERPADRDGARDPLRGHRDRGRPARHRVQGRARHADARRPLPARAGHLPARLGLRLARLDPDRAAGQGDRPVPGLRGGARRGHVGVEDPPAASRSRRTSSRRSASRTCSASTAVRTSSRASRRSRTATSSDSGSCDGQAVRHHARRRARASPTRRAPGAPSGPSTCAGCRRAATRAPPARTCSSGSTTPRRAATRPPGGRSWRTTPSPP